MGFVYNLEINYPFSAEMVVFVRRSVASAESSPPPVSAVTPPPAFPPSFITHHLLKSASSPSPIVHSLHLQHLSLFLCLSFQLLHSLSPLFPPSVLTFAWCPNFVQRSQLPPPPPPPFCPSVVLFIFRLSFASLKKGVQFVLFCSAPTATPMDSSEGEESCSSTKGEKRGTAAAERRMPGELFDRRHFHEHFDTDAYLKDFYARVDDAAMQMVLFHLPNIVARLGSLPSLLDFGSGPTIHVAVCFRHTAEEIYLADYLPQNRDELCQWLSGQSKFDWSTVMRIIAAREAVPLSEIRQMEQKAREKIRAVLFCDCHSFPSVQIPDKIRRDKTFSAITTFFTLEYCCLSSYEYALAINHLSAHLAPDGVLIMGGVLEETWCAFGGRQFKCLFVSRKLMMECLRGAGLILERDQLDNELFYELDGMYILVARKMAE